MSIRYSLSSSIFRSLFVLLLLLPSLPNSATSTNFLRLTQAVLSLSPARVANSPSYDDPKQGRVIWVGEDCDYAIIETRLWFNLVETYSGSLEVGDRVEGALDSFGFKSCRKNGAKDVRLYVENYHLTRAACLAWLKEEEKCEW